MVSIKDVEFATSIGVLFKLKNMHNLKTLQETYKLLETGEMDAMIEILRIAYNVQNKTNLDEDQFLEFVGEKNLGFMLLADIFQKVVECLMFDGLTPEQVAERKKFLGQAENE